MNYPEWITALGDRVPLGFMGLRVAFHAGQRAERTKLERLRVAARELVDTWGDSPKDLAGDESAEATFRAALSDLDR